MEELGSKKNYRPLAARMFVVVCAVILLLLSILYMNKRWSRIRDVRRKADIKAITKALDYYYLQFDKFPSTNDDDGDGWDKSNDLSDNSFLDSLVEGGFLTTRPFDPTNDEVFYYRYQKFDNNEFGCRSPYAIFQVAQFETEEDNHGRGVCPDIEWPELAPDGFTWLGNE